MHEAFDYTPSEGDFAKGDSAVIVAGGGYYDTTYYPRGGAFRRAPKDSPVPCTLVRPGELYKSGEPREWYVKLADGSDACVGVQELSPWASE